tara:strand:- start:387 stop:848 length:462 start_codon:yes stop_codon:yes gene_type:complete
MIKIRITLESKEDVIREFVIDPKNNLEYLHQCIINNLKLDNLEMASFFITNSNLDLIEEIPLFNISESSEEIKTMKNISISSVLNSKDSKLIYIYDFMNMWRFLIEFLEFSKEKKYQCTNKIGKMPLKSPELKFESSLKENLEVFHDSNKHEY